LLLAAEAVALLMMQPSELLKDLGMIRIAVKHTSVCSFGVVILKCVKTGNDDLLGDSTYVFLLFVNMTDLEPDIFFGQGRRRK
jgi:hypothetical protein